MLRKTTLSRLMVTALWPALATGCAMSAADLDDFSDKAVAIPARGSDTTLDIASWNIEWFGNTGLGPSNETLQRDNARDVIQGTDFDIWGVEEIVSTSHFESLLDRLPGYDGFLANDPMVESGSSFYSGGEQKVGIVFKTDVASVQRARVILTQNDHEFAGRPPLEVTMRVTVNGATEDLVVIVLHAKAISNTSSWERRRDGAEALKAHIDSNYPSQNVIVIGDFNDDVDTSITSGKPSPYQNFIDDAADYAFPTEELTEEGLSSTVSHPDMIDHHLATDELMAGYIDGSADVYFVDDFISRYGDTTSDHYPVLTRYALGGGGGGGGGGGDGSPLVMINEVRANEPGSSTAGEFVELVNVGDGAADLSGWTLSDGSSVRHVFGSTSLEPGEAIVVFGSSSGIPSGVDNATGASSGSLSLANGGGAVVLDDAGGAEIDAVSYSSSLSGKDGVSMNRSSDGDPGAGFVLHDEIAFASSSPGTRASGAAW